MTSAGVPDPYQDSFTGLVAARAVSTAVLLGLFEALAEGPATPAELAERLDLDTLGTDALTTALLALGYLERSHDGAVGVAPAVAPLLVSASEESIATFVGTQADLHWQVLDGLPQAVRDGKPYAMHEERRDPERWRAYIRGLFEISRAEQEANAALVPVEGPRRLADVAGGHGGFAMAMCRRHPGLEATVLDLKPSAAVGREIVAEQGLADRVTYREGDVFELGLGEDLDVVSVFNLVHHLEEDRNRELCRMARAALRPGGVLVVGDSERPDPAAPEQHGAISGLLFYAWSHSRTFTRAEISAWLEDAGFGDVHVEVNERSPWRIVVIGKAPQ